MYECAAVARCVEREVALCDRVRFDEQEVRLEILVAHHQLAKAHTVCCGQVHLGSQSLSSCIGVMEWCNAPCSEASADIVTNGVHNKWEWEQSTTRARQHRVGIGVPFQRASSVLHWLPRVVVTHAAILLPTGGKLKVFQARFSLCGRASHVGGGGDAEAPSTDGSQSRVDVGPRDGQEV